jgi:hypothetical protein
MTSSQVICSRKLPTNDQKEKYKTELCRNWMSGFCPFDSKCAFAHGKEELRDKSPNPLQEFQISQAKSERLSPKSQKRRLPVFIALSTRPS